MTIEQLKIFNFIIITNSVVNLGISTDLDMEVYTNHGMKKTNINFEIPAFFIQNLVALPFESSEN